MLAFLKFILAWLLFTISVAPMAFELTQKNGEKVDVTKEVQLFLDKGNHSIFDEGFDKNFRPLKGEEIKLNYNNHPIWFRFEFTNNSNQNIEKILNFNTPISGLIKVYKVSRENGVISLGDTGSSVPYSKRLIKSTTLCIPIKLAPYESARFYLRRISRHRFDARAFLVDPNYQDESQEGRKYIIIFYVGAIFSLIVSNIFLFLYTREKVYLLYSIFITFLPLLILCMTGYLDYFFADMDPPPSNNLLVFSSMASISALVFSRNFYRIKHYSELVYKSFRILTYALAVNLLLYLSPLHAIFGAWLGVVVDILIILSLLTMLSGALIAFKKGNAMAKFYLASWLFIFCAAFVFFGRYYGLFPTNLFTSFSFLFGNVLEMLTVSLGLGYKISILDKERKEARLKAEGKEQYQKLVRVLLHDVGNPLSLVYHYTSLRNHDPAKFQSEEEKIWPKLFFATQSIYDILDVVKRQESVIEGKREDQFVEAVNLSEVINESLLLFEEKINQKNLILSFDNQKDYSVCAEKVSLKNNVINNAISNAIKFTGQGGKIVVEIFEEQDWVILKVMDTGIGISKEYREAFHKQRKIPSRPGTQGERGTGYGLQLIDSYMEYFNGKFEINSLTIEEDAQHHGTTLILSFKKA